MPRLPLIAIFAALAMIGTSPAAATVPETCAGEGQAQACAAYTRHPGTCDEVGYHGDTATASAGELVRVDVEHTCTKEQVKPTQQRDSSRTHAFVDVWGIPKIGFDHVVESGYCEMAIYPHTGEIGCHGGTWLPILP